MIVNKSVALFIIVILSLPCITTSKAVFDDDGAPTKIFADSLFDEIRGIKIDFTPPEIIQECGSYFNLDLTLTKERPLLSSIFSISVFLKMEDNFGKNIYLIGSKAFVFFPRTKEKITVSVPCVTNYNFLENIQHINSIDKSEFKISDAELGVKIDKIGIWCIEGVFWRVVTRNFPRVFENPESSCMLNIIDKCCSKPYNKVKFILDLIIEYKMKPINRIRFINIFGILLSKLRNMNRLIHWEPIRIVQPFMGSTKFILKNLEVDEETDEHGEFNVNFSICNNDNYKVQMIVLIDISDKPFFSSIIPTISKDTSYNVGFKEISLKPNECRRISFKCSFPNQSFNQKDYEIIVECAPFINISNSSAFGLLFYEIRYKLFLLPNYDVNSTVLNTVKKLWYNTPIFNGSRNSATAFFTVHEDIMYRGKTPMEEFVGEVMKEIQKNSWFFIIIIFLLIFSYGIFFGFINWMINKNRPGS